MEDQLWKEPFEPGEEIPRIYLASLSDYVNGYLHGQWIDATEDIDDIQQAVTEMLTQSPTGGAEEYAIHDYEGFGPYQVGEYEPLEKVIRVARGIAEYGLAFAHWVDVTGVEEADYDRFSDYYLGHWSSLQAYAEELVDDLEVHRQIEELNLPFHHYIRIDTESLAQDLRHDYTISEDDDGVHIWSNQ